MTDARNDHRLLKAIAALPRGSGIIFRHYHLPPEERHRRFCEVRTAARRRGLVLLIAGDRRMAVNWRADGCYNGSYPLSHGRTQFKSAAVHNAREMHRANRRRVDMVLLSPVYPTRSHPGQRPLRAMQIRRLMALSHAPVVLLGGMTRQRFAGWKSGMAYGWAGIDGLS